MSVEFEQIGEGLVEHRQRVSTPEKKEKHATRISPSDIEVVYPLIDNLLSYSHDENTNPLIAIPLKDRVQQYKDIQNSFQGTCLHTAQMLSLVFSRHDGYTSVQDLEQHFPTFPQNGLEIMSYFGNRATSKSDGADRIFQIYRMYHDIQGQLIGDGLHISKKDLLTAWQNKRTETRVRNFIGSLYYLYNTNHLKVSNPDTIMQFEVGLIPLFEDLHLQSPMSIDMIVKAPREAAQTTDLKKGTFPDMESEVSLHQRYLMDVAARHYVQHLEGETPTYFGSPVIQAYISAIPAEYGSLEFFYSSDRFDRDEGYFQFTNATIPQQMLWRVYSGLKTRSELINDNKPIVRRYLSLFKHTAPLPNIPSVFRANVTDNEDDNELFKSLV